MHQGKRQLGFLHSGCLIPVGTSGPDPSGRGLVPRLSHRLNRVRGRKEPRAAVEPKGNAEQSQGEVGPAGRRGQEIRTN